MRRADSPLHVYAHLPVCRAKCPYCDFPTTVADTAAQGRFVDALLAECQARRDQWPGRRLESIYLGGGTPSVANAKALEKLVQGIENVFGSCSEVTLEANPEDVADSPAALPTCVDRVVLGVQSFDDALLDRIDRAHDADTARASVQRLGDADVTLGIDMLFGVPGQSVEDWERDLEVLASLADGLDLVFGWELSWDQREAPEAFQPVTEAVGERPSAGVRHRMLQSLDGFAADHGFQQREVGVYSRPGVRRRYMEGRRRGHECLALGPSAHGLAINNAGVFRHSHDADPAAYLDDPTRPPNASELSAREFLFVRICQGLELADGLSVSGLHEQFDEVFGADALAELVDELPESAPEFIGVDSVAGEQRIIPTADGLSCPDRVATRVAPLIPS
jgi:oxygen-independent coproporphyrinogen-3 oxidase